MATLEDLEGMLEEMDGKIDVLTAQVGQDRVNYKNCHHCNGYHMIDPDPTGCTHCGGTGFVPSGKHSTN